MCGKFGVSEHTVFKQQEQREWSQQRHPRQP